MKRYEICYQGKLLHISQAGIKGHMSVCSFCSLDIPAAPQAGPADADTALVCPISTTLWAGARKWVLRL